MPLPQLTELGTFHKTHGYKGHLKLLLHSNIKELLLPEALFIFKNSRPVPYFVDGFDLVLAQPQASQQRAIRLEYLIHFEDFSTLEQAASVQGKTVWADSSLVVFHPEYQSDWSGFEVFDQNNRRIGPVVSTVQLPVQLLISVSYEDREILIPLAPQTLMSFDETKKTMQIEIADGLLEL